MITRVPDWAVPALFSPNLMRTIINQSKKEDRFLHSAALTSLQAVLARVQRDGSTAFPVFVALTSKNGSVEFDRITKTKTLEHVLISADDESLRRAVRHLNSLVLRPDSEDQTIADSRRHVIADMLLNIIKQYKRYNELVEVVAEKDNWLRRALEILVEYAYFVPSHDAKTSKVPLPPISERTRTIFQERLSSCLTKLFDVNVSSRSAFALMVVIMIRNKSKSSKSLDPFFKADKSVTKTIEEASLTLDAISAQVYYCSHPRRASLTNSIL